MGRRIAVFGALIVLASLIETTLVPVIALRGFQPDLLLLVVLAAGASDGPFTGIRVALAAGLVSDLLISQSPFGVSVAVYALCGYGVGMLRPYVYRESVVAAVALGGLFTFMATVVSGGATVFLADVDLPWFYLFEVALIAATVNAFSAPVVFPYLPKLLGPYAPAGGARHEL
jgi:rod shape-determining protein MreD